MSDLHRNIASVCLHPQPMNVIVERVGCTRVTVYNLVARGLLVNVGNKRDGRFQVPEGAVLEAERTFRAPAQIAQVSSVWHYAQRLGGAA